MSMISSISKLYFLTQIAISAYNDDHVSSMPFYTGNEVNFNTYAGYLTADSGELFYIFEESSDNPTNDPLVLWLNGGPGCSSLLGHFIELGPYYPYSEYGTELIAVEYNPYAWNNFANMLFIESPPCVGYSYPHSMNCSAYHTNDNQTKWDNYIALQSFFQKYPEYKKRTFMISGESYAGHYVPQLASLIVEQNKLIKAGQSSYIEINLDGIAIGNPYMGRDRNWFKGWVPTMYSYGIINNQLLEKLTSNQCANETITGSCANMTWSLLRNISNVNGINVYDINVRFNCSSRSRQETQLLRHVYDSVAFKENLDAGNMWAYPYSPCNEHDLLWLMNEEATMTAFHVNQDWMKSNGTSMNHLWEFCANINYDVNGTDHATDQVQYVRDLLSNDVRVLVYSGNNDLVCAYSSTREWIYNSLNETYTGKCKVNWTSWYVNGQVGGWYEAWDKLTFMVVRDAGHEVPEYQPIRAYSLFERFISNNYDDIPVVVKHAAWNNYDVGLQTETRIDNGMYIGIGIFIGICISLLIGLVMFGVVWMRKKKMNADLNMQLMGSQNVPL